MRTHLAERVSERDSGFINGGNKWNKFRQSVLAPREEDILEVLNDRSNRPVNCVRDYEELTGGRIKEDSLRRKLHHMEMSGLLSKEYRNEPSDRDIRGSYYSGLDDRTISANQRLAYYQATPLAMEEYTKLTGREWA